jgi:hypothetical protein
MPRKRSAHQQLDEHRQRVADEGTRLRELQERQAQAEAELERIGGAIASAYASEDEREIAKARKGKEEPTARVEDLAHRTAGASLRAERAREELATFMRDHARDLLDEREETAREVAAELTRAVAATVRAHRAYVPNASTSTSSCPRFPRPAPATTAPARAIRGRTHSGNSSGPIARTQKRRRPACAGLAWRSDATSTPSTANFRRSGSSASSMQSSREGGLRSGRDGGWRACLPNRATRP